ncbi:hypothetical protein [Streptomyces sp. NPDC006335]|uniref:hypothetical protein n=1 Tax=Streptomyces sp. NPDC006335 TaxID=3156895 RepID=UPI0033AC709D
MREARAYGTFGQHPEDRADFERALRLALDHDDIRPALRRDRTGRTATRLEVHARSAAEEIAAAADDEYRAYLAAREAAGDPGARSPGGARGAGSATADGTVRAAVAVLAPLVSAAAAAVLLLIGYGLRLAAPDVDPGASVATAGWTLAVLAVLTGGFSLWALASSALRRTSRANRAERARERWRHALLERGVLPYLRNRLLESEGRGALSRAAAGDGGEGELAGQFRELPNSRR